MSSDARGVTPYRKTWVRFDIAENTLREPPFALWRSAHQIAQGHQGQANSQNWHFLETGAIAVRPWSDDPSNLHEKVDAYGSIVPLSDFQTIQGMVERPTFRAPTDLLGVTVDPSVQPSGDPFMQKTVAAGATWAQTLDADQTAFGRIPPQGYNVHFDRVAVGGTSFPDNQAFLVRLVIPASAPHYKQSLGGFYFGGPISQNTSFQPSGVYCVEFTGWGFIRLHIRKPDGNGGWYFAPLDYWEAYSRSNTTQVVSCRIWPHYTSNGTPCIQFNTETDNKAAPGGGNLLQSFYGSRINPHVHIWYGWKVNNLPVTGPGPVRIDIPRPYRPAIQISVLKYVAPAFVEDDPFAFDFFPTLTANVTILWQSFTPDGTEVLGGLYDADTGDELNVPGFGGGWSGPGYKTYRLNPGQYFYFARFSLFPSDDGNSTPLLYGYKVIRDGVYDPVAPGETVVPTSAILRQLSISGPDKDLTHETASATLEDPFANLSNINTRARVRTRIETEYDPADSTKRSVLFDGFLDRADGRLKGSKAYEGFNQSGALRQYPSQQWKEFACTFSGIWRRLREKLTFERLNLAAGIPGDVNDQGEQQSFLVTYIVRKLLSWVGFAPDEIDVPDSPVRFLLGSGGADELLINPLTEIGDAAAGLLHDYLGWFLAWDGNAGARGMIRAIVPPPLPGPYTSLATFTLDPPSSPIGKFTTRPESYGSVGWYATGTAPSIVNPVCFIRKKTFQTHVKPPEANAVKVTSTGQILSSKGGQYQLDQWAFNPKSYNFFVDANGSPIITAHPSDPDYIGEFIPLVVVNTSLSEQSAVDILTRRLYDVACHAQKWAMFEAPLCLVIDPNDTLQSNPRPLRYYDAVSILSGGVTTTWIVRSVNPSYRKDAVQMAHYELLFVL